MNRIITCLFIISFSYATGMELSKENFILRIENQNSHPMHVAIVESGWTSSIIKGTTHQIASDSSITIILPKNSAYKRKLYWHTEPIQAGGMFGYYHTGYADISTQDAENQRTITIPNSEEVGKPTEVALELGETFDLIIENNDPKETMHVAIVDENWGYTKSYYSIFKASEKSIAPNSSITIQIPKKAPHTYRWLYWDTTPIVGGYVTGYTYRGVEDIGTLVSENTKNIKILSPAARITDLKSKIQLARDPKQASSHEFYLLKIKNLEPEKPIHVALVAGTGPESGLMAKGSSFVSYAAYSFERLTESRTIPPLQSITFLVPKDAHADSLWIFWDLKEVTCQHGVCNYHGTVNLGTHVMQEKVTQKIISKERKEWLQKKAQDLIIQRNATAPEGDTELTYSSKKATDLNDQEESEALKKREAKTKPIIQVISKAENIEKTPRIGLCFSGGGLRAMFSSLGFTQGLDDKGLLGAVTYTSGLSGSTWFLLKWLEQGGKPAALQHMAQELSASMQKGLVPKELLDPITKQLNNFTAFKEFALGGVLEIHPDFNSQFQATLMCPEGTCSKTSPAMIDLWGYFLGRRIFKNKENKYQFTLSSLKETASTASMPIPIFTSVDSNDSASYYKNWANKDLGATEQLPKNYRWFEITPFSALLRSQTDINYIPTWAFGRKYTTITPTSIKEPSYFFEPFLSKKPKAGSAEKPIEYFHIEPSAIQLLGAFGSAFTVSAGEVAKMMKENIATAAATVDWGIWIAHYGERFGRVATGIGGEALIPLVQLQEQADWFSSNLIQSPQDNQFFGGLNVYDFSKGGNNQLQLRDAGVFYNLPLPALCDARRNLDVIIIHDTSGDLHLNLEEGGKTMIGSELNKFRLHPEFAGKQLPKDLLDNETFEIKMNTILKTSNKIAVFNDPRDAKNYEPDILTIVYIPTVQHPRINGLSINPTQKFGTFKLQYNQSESNELMKFGRTLAAHYAAEIRAIISAKTRQMNTKAKKSPKK